MILKLIGDLLLMIAAGRWEGSYSAPRRLSRGDCTALTSVKVSLKVVESSKEKEF